MKIRITPHETIPNVVWARMEDGVTTLATTNLAPETTVYDERLFKIEGVEYRTWNPYRSKLAAMLKMKCTEPVFQSGNHVLYLGAASGTTVSHVSDIIGAKGIVYAVEFAPRSARDLLTLAETRNNIVPILADAHTPETYAPFLTTVDTIYQDVAQPDQSAIAIVNAHMFLTPQGYLVLAIKARSIDVKRSPAEIYREQEAQLLADRFSSLTQVDIETYEKDHTMLIMRYRPK